MRFKFRLERVLEFIELKEREKRMEVSGLANEVETIVSEMVQLEKESFSLFEQNTVVDQAGAEWLKFRTDRVLLNRATLAKLDEKLVEKNEMLAIKKYELSRVGMRKKALETLREKKRHDFTVDESRKDQKRLDESYRLSKLGK